MLHVPPQGLNKMQRAFGRGECFVKTRGGMTALDRLWQGDAPNCACRNRSRL